MALVVQSNPPIEKAIAAIVGLDASASNIRQVRREWRKKLARVLKAEAIPAMRNVTPKRTGAAAKSLRVKTVAQPFGLDVGPSKQGFYLMFHPDAEALGERYHNIVLDVFNRHSEKLLNEAINEIYGLEV